MFPCDAAAAGLGSRAGVDGGPSGAGGLLPLLVAERSARFAAEAALERSLTEVLPWSAAGAGGRVRRLIGRSLISVGLLLGGAGRAASASA